MTWLLQSHQDCIKGVEYHHKTFKIPFAALLFLVKGVCCFTADNSKNNSESLLYIAHNAKN